jgi:hypothetical protein
MSRGPEHTRSYDASTRDSEHKTARAHFADAGSHLADAGRSVMEGFREMKEVAKNRFSEFIDSIRESASNRIDSIVGFAQERLAQARDIAHSFSNNQREGSSWRERLSSFSDRLHPTRTALRELSEQHAEMTSLLQQILDRLPPPGVQGGGLSMN